MVHLLGFILVLYAFDDFLHAVADAGNRNGIGTAVAGTLLWLRLDLVVAMLTVDAALALFVPVAVLAVLWLVR